MAGPVPTMSEVPAELLSKFCPNCGYSLEGLPSTQDCPECGRALSKSEIVLYGWPRGYFENIFNAKSSRLWWVILFGNFYVISNAAFAFRVWIFQIAALISLAIVLYALFRRSSPQHPGTIQIRLYPHGCVQLNDLNGPSALIDIARGYGWIGGFLVIGMVVIWAWRHHDVGTIIGCAIGMIPVAIFTTFLSFSAYRHRQARRFLAENAIADSDLAYSSLTKWADVGEFSLVRIKEGRYRLRLQHKYKYRVFAMATVADAELELNTTNADLLRDLIYVWRGSGWDEKRTGSL